jgi:hypothetical protein
MHESPYKVGKKYKCSEVVCFEPERTWVIEILEERVGEEGGEKFWEYLCKTIEFEGVPEDWEPEWEDEGHLDGAEAQEIIEK